MELLHAYWRMEYISAPKESPEKGKRNPFVDLPLLGDDRKALILYRGKHTYLILNKFPYNPGHCMAIPFREVAELELLSEAERNDLMATIVFGKQMLSATMRPDGFNVGINLGTAAGAGVPTHLHCHIVPRWSGDNNFMPVLGHTRVLPEALDATWAKLSEWVSHNRV
ncbi:MAG: HIT domain-containing protein [Verrucomicrobiota bacterium]|nr:HIT domain-containing protein [Verrucomicrobiota bacterium]